MQRFGFFPPFFEPALLNAPILENLWQQTLFAYVDNPIPAEFKEKLAALLSRYCPVPYCLVCHASALRPLGVDAAEILSLLEQPTPSIDDLNKIIAETRGLIREPLTVWPEAGSSIETTILYLAIDVSQNPEENRDHHQALKEFLAPQLYDYLTIFLAYSKTCLVWAEAHPELSYEADRRAQENLAPLIAQEPLLAKFLENYRTQFRKAEEWRRHEVALRKTDRLFKLMVESVTDYAIIMMNLEGKITEWNIGAERLLGYSGIEVIGQSLDLFFTPEDRANGVPQKEMATARATGHARDERFHLRKDRAKLWVKGFMTAVKSEDGTVRAFVKIMQDLTERQKMENELARWTEELEERVKKRTEELAQSQEAFHRAQKLEAVGHLAGGVAHDFNNLITGILGMSESLLETLEVGDSRIEDVQEIIKASNRAFNVTRQLLAFGRRQIVQPRVMRVNVLLQDLLKLLERVLGEDIDIRLQLNEKGAIQIDAGQLEQVLMNLAINARDAMPDGGALTVRTADVELHDGEGDRHFQVPAGLYVMLEISDTGHGMSKEVLAHIFEPFYTTKAKDRGTGLGLATVYGIVQQNQGDIHVYSEPGVGTAFKLFFPVTNLDETRVALPTPATLPLGFETILVIEDEDIVRKVAVKRLRQHGYIVLEASTGPEGYDLVKSLSGPLHLILTDVVMPSMNGKEVVDKIRQLRPDVPALFMSGYPEDIISFRNIVAPGIDFVEKSQFAAHLIPKVQRSIATAHAKKALPPEPAPTT